MCTPIILAAGSSRRFGTPKGLIPWKNQSLFEWQIQCATEGGLSKPIAVLGDLAESYLGQLPQLKELTHIVINRDPSRGPFSSLIEGLQGSETQSGLDQEGYFIAPLDSPIAEIDLVTEIFRVSRTGQFLAVVPEHQGIGGHPIWISGEFAETLLKLPLEGTESRLDLQLRKLDLKDVHRLPWKNSEILININSQSDLAFQKDPV